LAHSRSAQKQVRGSERKRLHNRAAQSQAKTYITRAERLIFSGELEAAQQAAAVAISALDKAAEKGILHRNNAARRKSRLMQKLNQAQASSLEKAETEESKETKKAEK
jgi:small subunit ribosomal protein S20